MKSEQFYTIMADLLNACISTGYVLNRWKTVANAIARKDTRSAKNHKTVRDTTVASAYHWLKSDDDVIRAIEDLESRIPMAITYH
jgi:hypothetical protein